MTDLYRADFFGWTQLQADALQRRSLNEMDWENLQEEIESLGAQKESELHSHFVRLLQHLLKWTLQPERRGSSWYFTIVEQRRQIERLLRKNPSLGPQAAEVAQEAYEIAVLRAAREMGRREEAFPAHSPFTLEDALTMEVARPEQDQTRSRTRKVKP